MGAPQELTLEQIAAIRRAAATWRSDPGLPGPKSDGQVRDIIEVLLGTAMRPGEAQRSARAAARCIRTIPRPMPRSGISSFPSSPQMCCGAGSPGRVQNKRDRTIFASRTDRPLSP